MPSLARSSCALLLALPLAALADPVTVTTSSSGVVDPGTPSRLGMEFPPGYDWSYLLPYRMTITSRFDADDLAGAPDTGPGRWLPDAEVEMLFDIGTTAYRYTGSGTTTLGLAGDGSVDLHQISFQPQGSRWIHASASHHFNGAGAGYGEITLLANDPGGEEYWSGSLEASTMSQQLIGVVPEPSAAGMLAAGMLALGAWRLRRRGAA